MSADNWRDCPRCYQEQQTAVEKVQQSYGKVPLADYNRLMEEARKQPEPEDKITLREDYEIGIWNGVFSVSYSGVCQAEGCDFSFKYKHEEPAR